MNEAPRGFSWKDLDLALTDAARTIAEQQGLQFARRVRTTTRIKHDMEMSRYGRTIYLHRHLSADKMLRLLTDGVVHAYDMDFHESGIRVGFATNVGE